MCYFLNTLFVWKQKLLKGREEIVIRIFSFFFEETFLLRNKNVFKIEILYKSERYEKLNEPPHPPRSLRNAGRAEIERKIQSMYLDFVDSVFYKQMNIGRPMANGQCVMVNYTLIHSS